MLLDAYSDTSKKYKEEGGNLSGLVCYLLEKHFFGDNSKEVITKEMLQLLEIKERLEKFEKWKEDVIPKIQELENRLKKELEEQETEEDLKYIRILRETWFDDLAEKGFDKWAEDKEIPERPIRFRLKGFAEEYNINVPKAVKLFFKAFPELKDKLEGLL